MLAHLSARRLRLRGEWMCQMSDVLCCAVFTAAYVRLPAHC